MTYLLAHLAHTAAWWVVPIALVILLPWSIQRVVLHARQAAPES